MMLASIVGQASFQTAARSGPSTMERSYRMDERRAAPAGNAPAPPDWAEGWLTAAASLIGRKLPARAGGGEHGASVRYLPIVNGALALTVPHSMRSRCPPPLRSMSIVSCSTGFESFCTVIGVRAISSAGRYGTPHCPSFSSLPKISCHARSSGCVLIVYEPGWSTTLPKVRGLSVVITVAASAPVRHGWPGGMSVASARPLSFGRPYEIATWAPLTVH